MLPPRLPKKPKRASRWKSAKHRAFVADHACCRCGSKEHVEAAHVRMGSGTGMGQKPDDWRTVSLCHGCHNGGGPDAQHTMGERAFWKGLDVDALMAAFAKASPCRREIEAEKRARGLADA